MNHFPARHIEHAMRDAKTKRPSFNTFLRSRHRTVQASWRQKWVNKARRIQ